MDMENNSIKEILHDNGYKYTKQRKVIYNVLVNNKDDHLSCDDIFGLIEEDYPEFGIATVYRTIQLFEKMGIVDKVNFDDGFSRYELSRDGGKHNHHHLICLNCHKVMEVQLDLLETLEEQIEIDSKFNIIDHNVKFYGYCEDCQK